MGKRLRGVAAACALAVCMMLTLAGCTGGSEYQPELKSPEVSKPTIGQDGTLRVGVNTGKSPLAGTNSEGKIIGVDVDIAAAIADELGLKLSIVDVGSNPASALTDGKVDIVMEIDPEDAPANCWTSEEYLATGVTLMTLGSSNAAVPTSAQNPTIAAQVSSTSAWAVTNEFGDSALKSTANLPDAFTQLEAGTVQYVACDAINGMYAARSQDIDVAPIALMSAESGYCIGVSKTNTQLQTVIADALAALDEGGIIDLIETKWLGEPIDLSALTKTAKATSNTQGSEQAGDDADAEAEGDAGTDDAAEAEGAESDAAAA